VRAWNAFLGVGIRRRSSRQPRVIPADEGRCQRGRLAGHAPAHRFDITSEADLIEEVARIIGYQAIPEADAIVPQAFRAAPEGRPSSRSWVEALAMRGYEDGNYLRVRRPVLQKNLFPEPKACRWPIHRQRSVGPCGCRSGRDCFVLRWRSNDANRTAYACWSTERSLLLKRVVSARFDSLAGVATGTRLPEQWGNPARNTGARRLLRCEGRLSGTVTSYRRSDFVRFEAPTTRCHAASGTRCPGAAPGSREVGSAVAPVLVKELDLPMRRSFFELEIGDLTVEKPQYREISRSPRSAGTWRWL